MPVTDLLKAKINQAFDHLDADGDGLFTEDDHVLMGKRAAEVLGYESGSPPEQRMVDAYLRIWRGLHLPHLPGGSTTISREQFLASTGLLADDPEAAAASVGALAEDFLAIADVDGGVTPREFFLFQRAHFPGLTEADATEAFAHLDTDDDGRLTTEEFISTWMQFWTSTDPAAPGNWWMGRLVE